MSKRVWCLLLLAGLIITVPALMRAQHPGLDRKFQTSDRCQACHNGLKTSSGQDISIGLDWRASIMANSARDPYSQGSLRREIMDHPKSEGKIQNECTICHMPIVYQEAKAQDLLAEPFAHIPFDPGNKE